MRILVDIAHPAHVHFFKNIIKNLQRDGHQVKITAKEKEMNLKLLDIYGFEYQTIAKHKDRLFDKALDVFKIGREILRIAKEFKPDILMGVHHENIAHVSRLIRKPSVIFTDSEPVPIGNLLTFPFASAILTPSSFRKELGPKHVRYNGYKELTYLHPNYFKPDPRVLDELGLSKDDRFFIFRFVGFWATHDIFRKGLSLEMRRKIVGELENFGRVFITSESKLPLEFDKYRITVPPNKIHDFLFYATLLVGDTQTMTTEAAVLGTPAIRCNTFVGPNDMGNFIELEKRYDLIYSFRESEKALAKVLELLEDKNLKNKWRKKREKLLSEKIDVTKFITEFIENYPESLKTGYKK